MKVVRAQATDGRVYRATGEGYHVTGKSANSAYRQMRIFGGGSSKSLDQPYKNSAWVMRAIKIIAQPIASLSIEFYLDKRKGDQLLSVGPAVEFWADPFRGVSRVDGIEATVSWLKLEGNAFWLKDDSWFNGSAIKSRLIIANPSQMTPVIDAGELIGWRYRDKAGRSHNLPAPYVEHIKNWNPYDDIWGLSEWEAARMSAEADYFAGRYNRSLMAGSGDQGDVVVAKGGALSDGQRDQIIQQLRARKIAREQGRFIPIFLTGDVAIENPKVTTVDASFVASRLENRHEIFIAFGVPPSMADVKASYSIGADSDYARSIEQTSMPAGAKVCEHIENISKALEATPLFVCFAWEENSVVQAVRRERIDAATKFWDRGMSWQTVNQVLDLGLVKFPGWEKSYVSFGLAEVGGETNLDSSEEYAEQEDPDPAAKLAKLFAGRSKSSSTRAMPTCGACGTGGIEGKASAASAAKWRAHMVKRRTTMKVYESKFRKELLKARAAVIAKIEKASRIELVATIEGSNVRVKAAASDFIFNLADWKRGLLAEMRKAGNNALKTAGEQLFAEIERDETFSMPPTRAMEFLSKRENRLSKVADEIYQQINASLNEGLEDGDTMDELANRIRAEFNGISKGRALTIASTETSAAYGEARDEAMTQAGVKYKQWLTSGNDNVRASHRDAEGQTVEIDQPFIVGGEELMYPGDPDGPPSEVINCHCVQIAVGAPEDNS